VSSIPILCYHKVGPIAEEGRRLNVEPERLREHARFFRRRGFRFGLPRELASGWPNRTVFFTFDDAYTSALTHGRESLEAESARGAFYAVPAHVGGSSAWDVGHERPLADWSLLRSASEAGHEIGNHTHSHADLSALPSEEQIKEIEEAHRRLAEVHLGPSSFCYPWGRMGDTTPQRVSHAGYRVGLALGKRMAGPGDDLLRLPRLVIAYGDSIPLLLYKMHIRPRLP
jgi:peptidoglycan/xylan/chitin deacetylase (PgdA/CDA1 family)